MTESAPTDAPLEAFDCPRCGTTVTERFWGPCSTCRSELTAAYSRAGAGDAEVQATRFEPAMHVVPNHVATKD